MTKSLTVPQLAERCQAATERYQQTGQSNEAYCFELFRRALIEQDESAWEAIYAQYQALVTTWVCSYSRFYQTGEEANFFVNEAFTRMWQYGSKPETAEGLNVLGKCLNYLKSCAWSAIEDHLRKKKKDAIAEAVALQDYDLPMSSADVQAERNLALRELSQVLWEIVQDDRERLMAEESWVYDLAPRQIQARHPEIFATADEVSQVKRNIIKRLKRRLTHTADD